MRWKHRFSRKAIKTNVIHVRDGHPNAVVGNIDSAERRLRLTATALPISCGNSVGNIDSAERRLRPLLVAGDESEGGRSWKHRFSRKAIKTNVCGRFIEQPANPGWKHRFSRKAIKTFQAVFARRNLVGEVGNVDSAERRLRLEGFLYVFADSLCVGNVDSAERRLRPEPLVADGAQDGAGWKRRFSRKAIKTQGCWRIPRVAEVRLETSIQPKGD